LRTQPLCEYWQLDESGPHCYDIDWLARAHEIMDVEEENQRRHWDSTKPTT
jgi:hypothetical protein